MGKIWKVYFNAPEHAASRQTFQNFLEFSSRPVGEDYNVNPNLPKIIATSPRIGAQELGVWVALLSLCDVY